MVRPGPRKVTEPVDFTPTDAVRATAGRAIDRGLCPECFGRLFGRLGHGLTNPERARRMLERLGSPPVPTAPCSVCGGLFVAIGFAFTAIEHVRSVIQTAEYPALVLGSDRYRPGRNPPRKSS